MKRGVKVVVIVGVVGLLGVGGWLVTVFQATSEAKAAIISDARVEIVHDLHGLYRFSPKSLQKTVPVGLVFFPGGMADPLAYAPLARAVAAAGYPAILVPLPRRGLFGSGWVPDVLHPALGSIHEDERAARWVVGGHSMGAAIAARLAVEVGKMGGTSIAGLILMGTVQPVNFDMASYKRPVTKIVATNDGLATMAKVGKRRNTLPASTRWVKIEGGNHSQFGWYGSQPGDHAATLSRDEQHQQPINAVLESLRLAGEPRAVPMP